MNLQLVHHVGVDTWLVVSSTSGGLSSGRADFGMGQPRSRYTISDLFRIGIVVPCCFENPFWPCSTMGTTVVLFFSWCVCSQKLRRLHETVRAENLGWLMQHQIIFWLDLYKRSIQALLWKHTWDKVFDCTFSGCAEIEHPNLCASNQHVSYWQHY